MDIEEVWTQLITQIKSYPNVNAPQIDAFFNRIQIQAVSSDFIFFTAGNGFVKDWVERHFLGDMKRALKDLYGADYVIQIEVDPSQESRQPLPTTTNQSAVSTNNTTVTTTTTINPNTTQAEGVSSNTSVATQQATNSGTVNTSTPNNTDSQSDSQEQNPTLNSIGAVGDTDNANPQETNVSRETNMTTNQPVVSAQRPGETNHMSGGTSSNSSIAGVSSNPVSSLSFDSFVIGDTNRMAYSMAAQVAERPTNSGLNPLFLHGRSGVGKTHLMCAIKNYINEQYPSEYNVIYIDSSDLINRYSDAAISKDFADFENFFNEADVLLVDDVQGLQGKPGTLGALFRIFNNLINRNKQIVLSADRAPKNIDLDERYVSRFNSGATIDIQPPDNDTKRGIIKLFVRQYNISENCNFSISDEIIDYVTENSSSNVRELKSAITKILFNMKINSGVEPSKQEVQSLLANHFISKQGSRLTTEKIQHAVEDFYKVSHKDLVGKGRKRNIMQARHVAIYLCRELLEETFKSIGKEFNRDHATAMHSYDLISEKLKEDRGLEEEIEAIREALRIREY